MSSSQPTRSKDARYVSIETAAQYLETSPRTVRRSIADGRLTGYRLGKRLLRVDLNQLDALLAPVPTAHRS